MFEIFALLLFISGISTSPRFDMFKGQQLAKLKTLLVPEIRDYTSYDRETIICIGPFVELTVLPAVS